MTDSIRESWLQTQYVESMSFAERSDVLSLAPVAGSPPSKYIARFACNGLVKTEKSIVIAREHLVGIYFPESFLRETTNPGQVLTWLAPEEEFHPNIHAGFCCVGHIPPGMSLLSLLHQLYQMITWQRFTAREEDALNREACGWARRNVHRFPVDPRRSMLKRTAPAGQLREGDDNERV